MSDNDETRLRGNLDATLAAKMQQPAATPERGMVSLGLIPEEQAMIRAEGGDPKDWAALIQQSDGMGVGLAVDPNTGQPAVKFVLEVHVPLSMLPLQFSNVVDPRTGQPQPSARMRAAFPQQGAPIVRMLVNRSAFADRIRNALDLEEARVNAIAGIGQPSQENEA